MVDTHQMDVSQLRQLAENCVIEKNGKFSLQYNKPLQGIDFNTLYNTRDEAVNAIFNALKTQHGIRAA